MIESSDKRIRTIGSIMVYGDFSKCSKKHKRALALESLLLILTSADRIGSDKDIPEGSRYIQITDTLARQMINTIHAYIKYGVEYLIR